MVIRTRSEIPSSEITPRETYMNRRAFMTGAAAMGVAAAVAGGGIAGMTRPSDVEAAEKLNLVGSPLSLRDVPPTPYEYITHYNNFYEFGVNKDDPAKYAGTLKTRPWTVQVEGLVKQKKTFDIDALLKLKPLEERVYRFRCVEGWSMVIPWAGYSLSELVKFAEPLPNAKFVQFISLADSRQMPEINESGINPPYSEGLRMDEAMHPLTLLTFGSYGQTLANQQGAPIRVIVPWKYGFKSAKSIVKIKFVEKMPSTTWNELNSSEYGFYSNVNPTVDHPRWTQASERRIGAGTGLFEKRVPTLMFNGYQDQVASLYAGMDLKKNY